MQTQEQDIKIGDIKISDDFKKIITDFCKDLSGTFPDKIKEDSYIFRIAEINDINSIQLEVDFVKIYEFCKDTYPQHFFMLLYQNNEFFEQETLELLPNINFITLWNQEDISYSTRCTIWKYLQLILFTVVTDVKSEESFGDAAKLFEAINGDEFQSKMEDTVKEMEELFKKAGEEQVEGDEDSCRNQIPGFNMPKAEDLHEHLNDMLGGKIGNLAKEIAEETAGDLDIDLENGSSVNDVFQKLFKNPAKLMDLVKNVGEKLDDKIKSGDIKESELLEEASDFINNMKNVPGMGNLESLFKKMGVPGANATGGKMDLGAMQRQMEENMKQAKMKERMRTKLEKRQQNKLIQEKFLHPSDEITSKGTNNSGQQEFVFKSGEALPEKSMAYSPNYPEVDTSNPENSKPAGKKKRKKKANKKKE